MSWGEADAGLPPLRESRGPLWDTYRMGFRPDGVPVQHRLGGMYAHPLYGCYVIADYLAQGEFDAARKVADASLKLADDSHGDLRWNYPATRGLPAFVSGLAQARWVDVLSRLSVQDGAYLDPAHDALIGMIRSCLVGGTVALAGGGTVDLGSSLAIEERPGADGATLILNGWLTALVLLDLHDHRHRVPLARDLVDDGRRALDRRRLLDLYDAPDEALSWYGLGAPYRRLCEWGRIIAGKRVNVYHWIHVNQLARLGMNGWSDRWRGYTERWPDMYAAPDRAFDDVAGALNG